MLKWNKFHLLLALLCCSFVGKSFGQIKQNELTKTIKVDSIGTDVEPSLSMATTFEATGDTIEIGPGVSLDFFETILRSSLTTKHDFNDSILSFITFTDVGERNNTDKKTTLITNYANVNDSLFVQGSWEIVNNLEWRSHFKSVFFLDQNNGWIVGEDGTIIHTTDGGTTWTPQRSDTSNTLYGVNFIDNYKGWIVGSAGIILHTTNGGQTWEQQNSGTNRHLHDVYFIDRNTGWSAGGAVGGLEIICDPTGCRLIIHEWYNTILHTTDGGETWSKQSNLGRRGLLEDLHFVNAQEGWAVGWKNTILHTTDGGTSWTSQSSPVSSDLSGVCFIDSDLGWITGSNIYYSSNAIIHTQDGGNTWKSQSSGMDKSWRGVDFVDAKKGWVVGYNGTILHTADGGGTWTTQNSGTITNLEDVFFVDDSTGWAVGDEGIILKYTVSPTNIVADFTGTPTSGTVPLSVQFSDESSGTIIDWEWNFGDGQTSTSQNPSHTYQNAGTYTVKLTVTGPGGSDSKTRSNYITVTEPNIVVSPDTLYFSKSSDGANAHFANGTELRSNREVIAEVNRLDVVDVPFKVQSLSMSTGDFWSDLDTLSNSFEPPFVIFNEQYQTEYEATKLVPTSTCTLKTLLYGFWNFDNTASRSKSCEFYIWGDTNGRPGTNLWSATGTISLAADEAVLAGLDVSEEKLVLDGAFWIGHREVTSGAPSSLADTVETPGMNFYSENGISWSEDAYDYLQMALVSYGGEAPKEEDTAMMTVYNTGNGVLEVSGISSMQSWVTSIVPTSFSVSAADSQKVSVRVSSSGLASGKHFGAIQISSNDPDTPEYEVPIVFNVGPPPCFWADIDCDGDVDIVDIQIVAGKWNTRIGQPNYDPRCDVDNEGQGDGDIDIVDIQLVAGWWNKPIPPGAGSLMVAKAFEKIPENVTLRVNSPLQSDENTGSYYVDVMIENSMNIGAFQFDIVSRDKGTKIDRVELGSFLQKSRNRIIVLGPERDTERNGLTIGAYSFGENSGASGSGTLARVRVTSESAEAFLIAFENVKLADSRGNLIPVNLIVNARTGQTANAGVPQSFSLNQNYPNPFNSGTVMKYQLPKAGKVTLKIYNVLGQEMATIVDEQKEAGYFEVHWDGRDNIGIEAPSGVYIYRIEVGSFSESKKMILLR